MSIFNQADPGLLRDYIVVRVNHLVNAGHRYMLTDRYMASRHTDGHPTGYVVAVRRQERKTMKWLPFHLVAGAVKFFLLWHGSFVAFICKSAISSKHRLEVAP